MNGPAALTVPAAGRSLWQDALARFRRHRAAMVSAWILGTITVLAILVPEFWPNSLDEVNWDYLESPPTTDNYLWFGTDVNGRDMFARTFYGARISLAIGVLTTGGMFCYFRAFSIGEANAVGPAENLRLIYAAALGFLLFAEIPSPWTVLGAAIIVASTYYIARAEARGGRGG